MAISATLEQTLSRFDCLPVCPEMRLVSDAQFYGAMYAALIAVSGISIDDVTPAQLQTAVTNTLCDWQDTSAFPSIDEAKMKALLLYLARSI